MTTPPDNHPGPNTTDPLDGKPARAALPTHSLPVPNDPTRPPRNSSPHRANDTNAALPAHHRGDGKTAARSTHHRADDNSARAAHPAEPSPDDGPPHRPDTEPPNPRRARGKATRATHPSRFPLRSAGTARPRCADHSPHRADGGTTAQTSDRRGEGRVARAAHLARFRHQAGSEGEQPARGEAACGLPRVGGEAVRGDRGRPGGRLEHSFGRAHPPLAHQPDRTPQPPRNDLSPHQAEESARAPRGGFPRRDGTIARVCESNPRRAGRGSTSDRLSRCARRKGRWKFRTDPARIVGQVFVVLVMVGVCGLVGPGAVAERECAPAAERVAGEVSWAQRRLGVERVWPLTRGDGVVGVVDTGVSGEAVALRGAVLPGTDLAGGAGNRDCSGHGTFLAGLIAARPGEGTFAGVAPGVRVLPVRVADDADEVAPERLAAGIVAAVDGGARVVAVGLVATRDAPELRAAVELAARRDVVVVASVRVWEDGQRAYPAALPGVLPVAPLGPNGPLDGPTGAAPLLAAPAADLVGIAPAGAGNRTGSGPELAVGAVAGAAALVRAYHPDLTARQVIARLSATADGPTAVVDPFAAVTTILTTADPPRPTPEHLVVPKPPAPDPAPLTRALWFAGALALLALPVAFTRRRVGDAPPRDAGSPPRSSG
ncbi:S8 family serine peptidase [Actinokineospora sp. NPDC004072]